MLNLREHTTSLTPTRLKAAPFTNPVIANRQQEEVCTLTLTNKQSVYGLFLDELIQYYKSMPFELDFSFLKSMRKLHSKGNEFSIEEHLQRAAEILIDAKNKVIKEQIETYSIECKQYLNRCPKALKTSHPKPQKIEKKKKNHSLNTRTLDSRPQFKKVLPQSKFFERVKSQGKQQNQCYSQHQKRSSFLLHSKPIKFQSSNEILNRVKLTKSGPQCRLPMIAQSNRVLQESIRSSTLKNKHVRLFFNPINRSFVSNCERGLLLRNLLFSSKHSEQSNAVTGEIPQSEGIRKQKKYRREVNLELNLPKREEEPRKHRKLMLQLLREKSKQALMANE